MRNPLSGDRSIYNLERYSEIIDDLEDDSAPTNDKSSRCIPALRRRKGRKIMFTSIVRRYQAWRRYETVRRELSHLTDRKLADIGISRSDIERIASGEAHS